MTSRASHAQSPIYTITADSLQNGTYDLSNLLWKYQPGDDYSWASLFFDDSNWSPVYTSLSSDTGPNVYWTGIGWFRINLRIDSSLVHTPLNLRISQYGASEIYLNGILIEKLGNISNSPESEDNYVTFSLLPGDRNLTLPLKPDTTNVLAVRYAIYSLNRLHKMGIDGGFDMQLINMKKAVSETIDTYRHYYSYMMLLIGIALAIFLLHLMLYLFYSDKISNLYYALLLGLFALLNILQVHSDYTHNLTGYITVLRLELIALVVMTLVIYQFSYSLTKTKVRAWDILPLIVGLTLIVLSWIYVLNIRIFVYLFLLTIIIIVSWRVIFKFIVQHKSGAYILGIGLLITLLLVGIQMLANLHLIPPVPGSKNGLLASFSVLGIIVSMSVYLAKDVADTNKNLRMKLDEVEELSRVTLQQKEKEIQLRLATEEEKTKAKEADLRAEAAELQLKIKHAENERRKKELEEARQLQLSMLPESLPRPDDFDLSFYMQTATEVGGDYYDYALSDDGTLTLGIGDATGHGLKAGTLVTATKSLFQLLADQDDITGIFQAMNQSIRQMNLGVLFMGMTIVKLKKTDNHHSSLTISAAGMPSALLYHADSGEVEEILIKGMPLGTKVDFPYKKKSYTLKTGDTLLMISDGITELFNKERELYGISRLISVFKDLAPLSSNQIIKELEKVISSWLTGNLPEDDITFVVAKMR